MVYKYTLYVSVLFISFSALNAGRLNQDQVFVPTHLGELAVIKDGNNFCIEDESGSHQVQRCFMDKDLRSMSEDGLNGFLENGYVSVSQMSDGEYSLRACGRLNGGGVGGATVGFYTGKFLTHFFGHGTIFLVASLTGPAFPVTLASLEATFAIPIEGASNVVGLGTGIAGGVITGPA